MDPMTMMMLAKGISSGVPALAQAGLGIWQNKKANDLADKLVDPYYDIPDAAEESLGIARANAGSRMMSGQTQAQQMIDQNYANTSEDILQAAGTSNDALGALVKANANKQSSQNELSMRAATDYEKRGQDLSRALAMMSGYEDKQFQINVLDKFTRDSEAASAMKNAAINNIFGGIKSISGAAGDAMAMGAGGGTGGAAGIEKLGAMGAGGVGSSGASAAAPLSGVRTTAAEPTPTSNMSPQQLEALVQALGVLSGNTPNYNN
jgi:hypothetical protein